MQLNPCEYTVVVKDPNQFKAEYGTGANIAGASTGSLDNAGEKINLQMPGDMVEGRRYYIRIDRVNYSDGSHPVGEAPWPPEPDGTGKSLTRKVASDYGNDVANW